MNHLIYLFFWINISLTSCIEIIKCCQEDNNIYDYSAKQCRKRTDQKDGNFLEVSIYDGLSQNYSTNVTYSENISTLRTCPDPSSRSEYLNPPNSEYDDQELTTQSWHLFKDIPGEAYFTEIFEFVSSGYCIEMAYSGTNIFLGTILVHCSAKDDQCSKKTCIRSLCPPEFVFNQTLGECWEPQDSEGFEWVPKISDQSDDHSNLPNYKLIVRDINCTRIHLYSDSKDEYSVDSSGVLKIKAGYYESSKYRLTRVEDISESGSYIYYTRIEACVDTDVESIARNIWSDFLVACQCISMIFLILLFVYLFISSRQKIFGILTMCMTVSLFFFYFFLVVTILWRENLVKEYPFLCVILAFCIQFSYQTSIFWLNAMCFDIWRTFKSIRRSLENEPKGWRNPLFVYYCLYAWGVPSFISLITLIMTLLPEETSKTLITPGFGDHRCFFESHFAKLLYFHLINFIIIVINFIFFTGSSWNLLCGVWSDSKSDPVSQQQNRVRYRAVFKLFFAMGISWIAEVISWGTGWIFGENVTEVWSGSAVFDAINALQGFTIFMVLVFDTANIKKIKDYFNRRNSTQNTNSSTYLNGSMASSFKRMDSLRKLFKKESRKEGKVTLKDLSNLE